MNPAAQPGLVASVLEEWRTARGKVLILSNLIPAAGVLFMGWNVYAVVYLYWAENVVIGIFHAVRMAMAAGAPLAHRGPITLKSKSFDGSTTVKTVSISPEQSLRVVKWFLVPFFCVHYGFFCYGHGIFVNALFKPRGAAPVADIVGPALMAMAAAHLFFFVKDYLIEGEWKTASPLPMMIEPYGRIVLLHVFILGSAFLMMALKLPPRALLAVVLIKTAFDCRSSARRRPLESVPLPA